MALPVFLVVLFNCFEILWMFWGWCRLVFLLELVLWCGLELLQYGCEFVVDVVCDNFVSTGVGCRSFCVVCFLVLAVFALTPPPATKQSNTHH